MLKPALVFLVLLSACVPKGRYEADMTDLATRHDGEIQVLEEQLEQARDRARALRRQLEETKSALEEKTAALDDVSGQLASKVAEAGQLQEDVVRMGDALAELAAKQARAAASLAAYRDLVDRFQSLIDAGTLQVKVIDGRMVVELATDILFAPGSADLSRDGQAALGEVAAVLSGIEEREYQVAGHTDDKPIATARFPSNWSLGAARAIEVVNVLVDAGLAPERVSAASFAEFRPSHTNRTPEGRAANRRIEIIVVPDLAALPGYDELQALGRGGAEAPSE